MTADLHFWFTPFPGALWHYGYLMRHLMARGHRVALSTMEPIDPGLVAERAPGLACHRWPFDRASRDPIAALRTMGRAP